MSRITAAMFSILVILPTAGCPNIEQVRKDLKAESTAWREQVKATQDALSAIADTLPGTRYERLLNTVHDPDVSADEREKAQKEIMNRFGINPSQSYEVSVQFLPGGKRDIPVFDFFMAEYPSIEFLRAYADRRAPRFVKATERIVVPRSVEQIRTSVIDRTNSFVGLLFGDAGPDAKVIIEVGGGMKNTYWPLSFWPHSALTFAGGNTGENIHAANEARAGAIDWIRPRKEQVRKALEQVVMASIEPGVVTSMIGRVTKGSDWSPMMGRGTVFVILPEEQLDIMRNIPNSKFEVWVHQKDAPDLRYRENRPAEIKVSDFENEKAFQQFQYDGYRLRWAAVSIEDGVDASRIVQSITKLREAIEKLETLKKDPAEGT